jgi:hypothetical protein
MRDHFGVLPIVAGMGFMRGIMLLDDCEGTFTYTVAGTGGDDVHEYLAAAAWQGAYGLHLKTRVTGAAADDVLMVTKQMDYPASGLLVARARLAPVAVAAIKEIGLRLVIDDGTTIHQAIFSLFPATSLTKYLNAAGTYTEITPMAMTYLGSQWYTTELAIDCLAKTYRHGRTNGLTADLSSAALYSPGASSSRGVQLTLAVVAAGAAAAEIYADNLYVGEYLEA